ncbi:hypothetical protein SAMN04488137_1006 [Fictibacillus solisalsi]|uniref:Uncharacterized protein n=1 Tax=Fictibacillus solisalsi TaxID=459525 RepID=A0A1G9ULU7_9BACL|nr:hypothetical protein [Fictibacillus solisalsi]SDM60909.1 hypothetical protein SAMN04488137_1006 [Fictibacillus solisalsi]
MFRLSPKTIIISVASILLFPVLVNYTLFLARVPSVFGSSDNWLSFWGNYTGGIVSAVVAYFVASSQLKKQTEISLMEQRLVMEESMRSKKINQLPALARMKIELRNMIYSLEQAFEMTSSGEQQEKGETITFIALDEDNWRYLDRIEDIGFQLELIDKKSFFKQLYKTLDYEYLSAEFRIEELKEKNVLEGLNASEKDEWLKLELDFRVNSSIQRAMLLSAKESNLVKYLEELLEQIEDEIKACKEF